MAQFFLIDPSWRCTGDHHAEFGSALVHAANSRQIRTRVAVHRDFLMGEKSLTPAVVVPLFRETSYQAASVLAGLQAIKRGGWARPQPPHSGWNWRSIKSRLQNWGAERRHLAYARRYAESLAEFFSGQSFDDATTVLFATASDLDFAGIGAYLRATPNTIQAHWHFLFHFNLFQGRTPEYEQQQWRLRGLRDRFLSALQGLPYHQLHFHTTTEHLADQYNRLQIAKFSVLPYPVIAPEQELDPSEGPLRLSCIGAVRREKQQATYLQKVINQIWDTHLAPGRVKLQVQTLVRRSWRRPKIPVSIPGAASGNHKSPQPIPPSTIEFLPHPLPRNEYDQLLRNTDCGLLLYDAETYFSRRAGILDELLTLGRPVVVSAGSWLADELSPDLFDYVQQIVDGPAAAREWNAGNLVFSSDNLPSEGGVLTLDHGDHPLELHFEIEPRVTAIALQFQWRSPINAGTYIRIEIARNASAEFSGRESLASFGSCHIVGHAPKGVLPGVILRIPTTEPHHRRCTVRLTNAFHDATICIQNLKLTPLDGFVGPIGSVGVTVADRMHLGDAIDEIVRHYSHYRHSAEHAATRRRSEHDPQRVLSWLFNVRQPARRAA